MAEPRHYEAHVNATLQEQMTALEIRNHVDPRSIPPGEFMMNLRSLARRMADDGVSVRPNVLFQLLLPGWVICTAEFGPPSSQKEVPNDEY